MSAALRPSSLRALVYRCPVATPVVTSFGTMRDRPMVLVRAEDAEGAIGWGEAWCNFPAVGAEHRARLIESALAPLIEGISFSSPVEAFHRLAQCIAGVDIALWDLAARRSGQPLWRMLGASSPRVRVYASGLNPDSPERLALARHGEGYRAFKLKIGFGMERDLANLKALRGALGAQAELMVDANQAWSLEEAKQAAAKLEPFALKWLEEPLRADRPWSEWRALAEQTGIPLAAGENLAGEVAFEDALRSGALGVVQPDIAKWGGFSGCLPLARKIIAAGLRFCPHYLGGGVGLLASAHLLAAAGGDGALEVDANPNPLRTLTCGPLARVTHGMATLTDEPGLGPAPDLDALREFSSR